MTAWLRYMFNFKYTEYKIWQLKHLKNQTQIIIFIEKKKKKKPPEFYDHISNLIIFTHCSLFTM